MTSTQHDGQTAAAGSAYRALLVLSEATLSHRNLTVRLHKPAGTCRLEQRPPGGACATGAALPVWRLPTAPRIASFRAVRNTLPTIALRGNAANAPAPARPLLWRDAGKRRKGREPCCESRFTTGRGPSRSISKGRWRGRGCGCYTSAGRVSWPAGTDQCSAWT
jgi:hypothetical protein